MSLVSVVYTFVLSLSISLLENADAQFNNRRSPSSWNVIELLETLSTTVDNLQTKIEMQASLLNNSVSKEELQATVLENLEAKADSQAILLNNLMYNSEMQVSLLYSLQNLSSQVEKMSIEVAKLSGSSHSLIPPNKLTVEGMIAGMKYGLVVISFDSREQRMLSIEEITGVAFDWSTKKVYWIESNRRIKRSNLDGTSVELLVSGSRLRGLAVDPITGNFYYGRLRPSQDIRVCTGSGRNCATIASGALVLGDIYDMALHPSESTIFWSNYNTNKTITRANMDGTDARVIITEDVDIYGIDVDEVSQRLYWANDDIIVSHDLNGSDRRVLLNATLNPSDVAVDGDTVYIGNWKGQSVSAFTPDRVLSTAANTTGMVRHIALYGSHKVHSRPNPCKNSPCQNVCVLNYDSFTCL